MGSFIQEFKKKISSKGIRIAVIGLGYVGLPLALEFAKKGFTVLGIDSDNDRIQRLKEKKSYITDVRDAVLKRLINNARFIPLNSFRALKQTDVVLVCVPTPLKRKYHPDISFIKSAVSSISRNINKNTLIILESTTYPGTTEEVILPLLESGSLRHGRDFYLCFSPERIDPGNKAYPLQKIPKVIGGVSKDAANLGVLFYRAIIDKVIPVSSPRIAETVKLLENTFRIINIGLIDEMAMMAQRMNIDIWEVIAAARTKPFGFMPFYPGPGVGGHCIPKDPLYLYWKAKHYGFKSRFIKLSSQIINHMPVYVVERLCALLAQGKKDLKKTKVLVIGVTYKKDVADLRKSPALDIIEALRKKKISVSYHDPLVPYLKLEGLNLKSIKLNRSNLKKFDCVVIVTDHACLDYGFILKNSRLIFDTRNVYAQVKSAKIVKL